MARVTSFQTFIARWADWVILLRLASSLRQTRLINRHQKAIRDLIAKSGIMEKLPILATLTEGQVRN